MEKLIKLKLFSEVNIPVKLKILFLLNFYKLGFWKTFMSSNLFNLLLK